MTLAGRLAKLSAARRCAACGGTGVANAAAHRREREVTDQMAAELVALADRIAVEANHEPTTHALDTAADLSDACFADAARRYLDALEHGSPDG